MAHILRSVVNKRSYVASDYSKDTAYLHKCIQVKSIPFPKSISREYYNTLKKQVQTSSDKSFASVAWSFRGKPWGGYNGDYLDGAVPKRSYKYYEYLRSNKGY